MTKLSRHFTEHELTRSQTGERLGIDNRMSDDVRELYEILCAAVLEPTRSRVGKPLRVSSGYRCPELNRSIGGSKTSAHMARTGAHAPQGEAAADIEVWGLSNLQLARLINHADTIVFDQVILEHHYVGDGPNSGWVHVSVRPGSNRREVLTAYRKGRRTVYAPGLHALERGQIVDATRGVVWPA